MKLIEEFIGKFGRYQALQYALLSLPFAMAGIQVIAFNFTGAVPRTRCLIPGHDDSKFDDFDKSDIAKFYAPPSEQYGEKQRCHYCPDMLKTTSGEIYENCTSARSIACDQGFVYSREQYSYTLATRFDLVCQYSWKRQVASSCFMFGFLVGALSAGALSDRFGRRPVVLAYSIIGILTYHLVIAVPNYPLLCILHIINGALCHGAYITAYVLVMELMGGLPRTILGIWVQGVFAIGLIYFGICAYFLRDYRWLQFAASVPSLALLAYPLIVPESIRWLIVHDEPEPAKAILMRAAEVNGKEINEAKLNNAIALERETEKRDSAGCPNSATVIDHFRHRSLAIMTLIICYTWFASGMSYYGLALNTNDLPGDDYTNFFIGSVVELVAFVIVIPMLEKWGRRPTMVSTMGLGGVAVVISALLPKSVSWLIVTLAMIGRIGAAGAFAVVYNYSAELFPTVTRNSGIGVASMCARIASLSSPLIYLLGPYVAPWLPFIVYGAVAIIAAALDMLLPETLNTTLPETISDGIALCKSKKQRMQVHPESPQTSKV